MEAIILGKIHRGAYKGKYLVGIDIDNKKGIEEFLSHFGKVDTLEKLAEKTIVEQHFDDMNKAHIYFIAEKPLSKKSGIKSSIDNSDVPAIEVKSDGKHGIMFCTPSIHANGFPYQIIGTTVPTVLDLSGSEKLEDCIDQIYWKNESSERNINDGLIPIEDLFREDYKVKQGNNRHEAMLRVMESLIARNSSIFSEDKIKELSYNWNLTHCEPPLDEIEFEKQWNDAKKFLKKKNDNKYDNENTNYRDDNNDNSHKSNSALLIEIAKEKIDILFKDQY
ncbi:MAG: hypothetical protein P0116_17115, partial [Candidatus Nitrosocosmicus sp.]|nr:hypothetical protein [Candidatus Nitrosocosmicus sp.]